MSKNKQLSEEQLSKIKKEVAESMAVDRHALLVHFPFTAAIAMRLNLVPIRDKRCRTACTDQKNLYFDCDWYSKLTEDERRFVMAHEVWHNIMLHFSRCQSRNRKLFNIATDMEVNNLLTDASQGINMKAPKGVLFPPANMKGKSAEEIYDWLLKQAKKNSKNGNKSRQGNSGNQAGNSSSSDSSQGNDDGDSQDGESYSDIQKKAKSKSGSGNLNGQFDKHKYQNDPDESNENGNSGNDEDNESDQWGEVGYDKDFNPQIDADAAEKMREAAMSAAQQCERTRGTLPAGVRGLLDKVYKPEIKWQDVLAEFVTSCYGDKRSWLPPNRRHVYNDMYFQSRRSDAINVIVAVDTSGSCIGDLPKFFGELKSLVDSFGRYTVHVIQCDANVEKYDVYDDSNPLEIEFGENFEWKGGGGTSFCPVFDFVQKEGIQADCLIYLTDSYGDAPEKQPGYPVLWLLTADGDDKFCAWGRKIKFKNTNYETI